MKYRLLLVALFFSLTSVVFADDSSATASSSSQSARDTYYSSGYILGLDWGLATTQLPDRPNFTKHDINWFGRIVAGYNLNHYFSVQLGYLYFFPARYTSTSSTDVKFSTQGYDGLLTVKYPLGEGFAVYGQGGMAWLTTQQSQSGYSNVAQTVTVPAYGGGLDYSFANISGLHMNLGYYHTNKKSAAAFIVPAEDVGLLGIYYQF